jgi:proteasome lid subunit RPN8/RPN11
MIKIDAGQLSHIRSLAERTYPEECCGLLIGRALAPDEVLVTRIVDSPNVQSDRAHDRFEIDPKVRLDAERSLRGTGERVVGHFHSHPDHPARPSDTDLAMAFEPDLVWVIVAVAQGRADEVRAFRLNETRAAFEPVTIVPGSG